MTEIIQLDKVCLAACRQYAHSNTKDLPHRIYGSNPNIVILGERHGDEIDIKQQMEIVRRLNPEFFIHEFLRNNLFDPHNLLVYEDPSHPTPTEIRDPQMAFREEQLGKTYDYSTKPRGSEISQWVKDVNFSLDWYACEDFSDSWGPKGAGIERLQKRHPTIQMYVGCDLSQLEKKDLIEKGTQEFLRHIVRERRMGEVIADYAKITDKPLIAVLGAHHVGSGSEIHTVLEEAGLSYLVIDQSFDVYPTDRLK